MPDLPTLDFTQPPLTVSPAARRREERREQARPRFEVLSLDDFDPRRLARKTDPESSREAARHALLAGRVRGHEERILRTLRQARQPLTAKEIGQRVGLSNVQVCRRTGERGRLRKQKLIRVVEGPGEQRFEVIL